MSLIQNANLALRFILELCALAALGYWGFRTGDGTAGKLALGIGAPLVAAVIWGTLVAPKAPVSVPGPIHVLLQVAVFGVAALALTAAGRPALALVFAVVAVINGVLMYVWGQ